MQTMFRMSVIIAGIMVSAQAAENNWPAFRGPNCSGISTTAKPPVKIGPDENVLWKIEVPFAPSSPCVWGERIFLTTFENGTLETRCYARSDGKLLWTRSAPSDHLEKFHLFEGSPAAATPSTDGKRVVSYFGSSGVFCYDFDGTELWRYRMPPAETEGDFGSGGSPLIVEDLVLLNRDEKRDPHLVALHLESGKVAWQAARPGSYTSFGTPIVWSNNGISEVVMPGYASIKAYDLRAGKERWSVNGTTVFTCTTPVVGDGLLFYAGWSPGKTEMPNWQRFRSNDKNGDDAVTPDELDESMRSYFASLDLDGNGRATPEDFAELAQRLVRGKPVLLAIRPGGSGDITDSHVAWRFDRGLPYVPSPLYCDGRVYIIKDGGMLSSFDAKTGQPYYVQERIDAIGNYYASPVAANGHIYVASLNGRLSVIKAGGDLPAIVHQADFRERIAATPALVSDTLYLRTKTALYAFREKL